MNAPARDGATLLLRVLGDRGHLRDLTASDWDVLLPAADEARLLGRLAIDASRMGLTSALPDWARDRLTSAQVRGDAYQRDVRWEIDCIQRALRPVGVEPVFLKGAAYIAAGLPCGLGRVLADVDILVAEDELERVESALIDQGWAFGALEAYDERYYREWMHELPPLTHLERGTILDVHHRILPRTGRRQPSTARLLEHSVAVDGLRLLSPEHMVLHAAAHLFQDGELESPVRELVDIAELLAVGLRGNDFITRLGREADALDLGRALFYGVRYASKYLQGAAVDVELASDGRWRPSRHQLQLMDILIDSIVVDRGGPAGFLMYVRANWLKMPPALFFSHLSGKALRNFRKSLYSPG